MNDKHVFILDDNEEFRQSTAFLLEAMGYQVRHYEEHEQVLDDMAKVDKDKIACLLLDIRMPKISGLDVHDLINERKIDLPIIYMTAHGDVPLAVTAMKKGALTFLEKPLQDEALQHALAQACSDEVQDARTSFAEREALEETRRAVENLTQRERQVADCIVNEMSNQKIAHELDISVKTVEVHRSRVMSKLSAKNAAHLVGIMYSNESM